MAIQEIARKMISTTAMIVIMGRATLPMNSMAQLTMRLNT